MFSSKKRLDVHCAKGLDRASWKEHTLMTFGSWTGTISSASRSFWTWSHGALARLSNSVLLKMYSLDDVLVGEAVLGELDDVVTGVVNLYVTGAGFALGAALGFMSMVGGVSGVLGFSSSEVLGCLTGF